jgi:hypothetical protein
LIVQSLIDFRQLGAKSCEISGGGNPLLYKDQFTRKDINHIIDFAAGMGYEVGIITNSHNFKMLDKTLYDKIKWIRVSLIKLDEGKEPENYDFNGFPSNKLGFSYIIYEGVEATPIRKKPTEGTTRKTIERIARLVEMYPEVKFVRLAGNCLIKGNNAEVKEKWFDVVRAIDEHSKFFIKDIDINDSPYSNFCATGMVRPYIASAPHSSDPNNYHVYICTSHVLQKRNYDLAYSLCHVKDIKRAWQMMNDEFKKTGVPYSVNDNEGRGWQHTCKFCYYANNNELLHNVAKELPDKNFA